jgi:hypothetical protein
MPTPSAKKEAQHCKPNQTPWWKTALEFGALVVGICAVIVYKGQWDAANEANKLTLNNFKAGQRAWVGLDTDKSTHAELKSGEGISYIFHYRNFGNSPATWVYFHVHTFPPESMPDFQKDMAVIRSLPIRLPNEPSFIIFNGQEITEPETTKRVMSAQEIDGVIKHHEAFVIGGKVSYSDIFSTWHTYMWCRILNVPEPNVNESQLTTCPVGDETD